MENVIRTVSLSELKDRAGDVANQVRYGGEPVVITKNGRPIAQVMPFNNESRERGQLSESRKGGKK